MAIADRIVLLDSGLIAQEGSPTALYNEPATLFTAEFMGSNNRLRGRIAEARDGRARIEGEGWSLWGEARGDVAVGRETEAVIRLEQVRVADRGEGNLIRLPLSTSMFLGDKWEHVFRKGAAVDAAHQGALALRAYSHEALGAGDYALDFPPDKLWIF
jgi:iron(III) transport system ATP-binding protein